MSITLADSRTSRKVLDAKKPIDRVQSLAETIIFCMAEDAPTLSTSSGAATPANNALRTATPVPAAITRLQNGAGGADMKKTASSDSLMVAGKKSEEDRRYLGGSKALDHLSRLLTSCETVSFIPNTQLQINPSSSTRATLVIGRRSSPSSCPISPETLWSDGRRRRSRRARLPYSGA